MIEAIVDDKKKIEELQTKQNCSVLRGLKMDWNIYDALENVQLSLFDFVENINSS